MDSIDAGKKKEAGETDIFSLDYGVCSHIGKRQQNKDEMLVPSVAGTLNGYGKLFAVADGMGSHPGGGISSQMACDRLSDIHEKDIQDASMARVKGHYIPNQIRHITQ